MQSQRLRLYPSHDINILTILVNKHIQGTKHQETREHCQRFIRCLKWDSSKQLFAKRICCRDTANSQPSALKLCYSTLYSQQCLMIFNPLNIFVANVKTLSLRKYCTWKYVRKKKGTGRIRNTSWKYDDIGSEILVRKNNQNFEMPLQTHRGWNWNLIDRRTSIAMYWQFVLS